jgi:uncharacterized coiled-coil protein SlyX
MENFRLFAPVVKIDTTKRLVYGVAASEATDKAGERFDYDSSAPEFRRWSAEIEKGSGGKSRGNVRIMHQPVVAGILTELDCDDAQKTINVCAKIVDDEAWKMVAAGAYTGFSIGGRYLDRWIDSNDPQVHRYTAMPAEISLVDNPANPDCHFRMIKEDGTTEDRKFSPGTKPASASPAPPHSRDGVRQRWIAADGSEHVTKAAALARNAALSAETAQAAREDALHAGDPSTKAREPAVDKGGDAPGEGKLPYGHTEYADPGFQSDGKKRYPIDTEAHIRAAWNYIHQPKNAGLYTKEQLDRITARIVAAWKDRIDEGGPPSAEDSREGGDKAASVEMVKHLSDTGQVACMTLDLKALKDRLALEAAIEGDAPELVEGPASAKVQGIIEEPCQFLEALVAEETREVIEGDEAPQIVAPANSTQKSITKLEADFAALTQTVGALSERVALGAEAVTRLTAERDELKARLAKVEAEPLPPKAVKLPPGVTAVEKGGGSAATPDLVAELQHLSPEEIQLLLIKAARRNPMRPVFAGPDTPIRS